jgi:rhodanese-related sulfurtransferase
MSRTISVAELKPLIDGKHVTVLDVRRQNDHGADSVTLPGAAWKNPKQIADWSKMLPKDKEIIIYCARGGSVSNSVLDQLLGQNFRVRYIEGGIEAWKAASGATAPKAI